MLWAPKYRGVSGVLDRRSSRLASTAMLCVSIVQWIHASEDCSGYKRGRKSNARWSSIRDISSSSRISIVISSSSSPNRSIKSSSSSGGIRGSSSSGGGDRAIMYSTLPMGARRYRLAYKPYCVGSPSTILMIIVA